MYISLETIESWPAPNYVNPVTRGPSIIIINLVSYSLVIGIVALRTFTRLQISKSFGPDDAFILLTMIPTTAFITITIVAEYKYGWDRHEWDVPPDLVTVGRKLSLASQILFGWAAACTRLSMLLLTRRILSAGNLILQKIITLDIVFVAATPIIFTIVVVFQCRPISAYWTLSFTPQHCINEKIHLLLQGVNNIMADFIVVFIPIPVVLRLNLPLRQRIIVSLLFGAGFIVCFAGLVRTYYFYRLTNGYHDVTWDAFPVWLSTAIELYIGILCTSIPPTKPFFARYIPKFISATSQYAHSHSSGLGYTSPFGSSKIPLRSPSSAGSSKIDDNSSIRFKALPPIPYSPQRERPIIIKKIEISQSSMETSQLVGRPKNISIESLMV